MEYYVDKTKSSNYVEFKIELILELELQMLNLLLCLITSMRTLIAIAIISAFTIFNPIVWTFVAVTSDRAAVSAIEVTKVREFYYESTCPIYSSASTYEKWTDPSIWDISWCKDYIHRL